MRPVSLLIVFFALAATPFISAVPAHASVEYCKVLQIFGRAEILEAGGDRWQPLSAPRTLKGGDKIRTSDKSYIDLASSSDLSGLMRLGPEAWVDIMGEDLTRFFLRKGSFYILREQDSTAVGSQPREDALFQVFTRDLVADLLQGGVSVTVLEKGTLLCVFSEHAKVSLFDANGEKIFSQVIAEGFKILMEVSSKPSKPVRLRFNDYGSWQFWMRKCYERKDELAHNFTAKA